MGNVDCATASGRNRIGCIGTILKCAGDEYAGPVRSGPDRRNIYLSLRFCAGLRFRFAIGKWNHASSLPTAASRLVHYNRATDSHSREFKVSSLSLARTISRRRRLVENKSRRKNCIAAGSRGNQINFNANLPASYRPQFLAFNNVISLANSHGNASLASCARNERKTCKYTGENTNHFNRAGFHRSTAVYR